MGEAHTSEECHQLAGKFASLLSDQRGEVILLFEGEESMEEVTGGALDAFRSLYHILSKTKVRVFGWDDKKSVKTITNGLEEPVALAYARLKGIVAEAVALGEADQAINKQMQETYNTLTQGRDRFLEMLQKFCAEDKLSEESFAEKKSKNEFDYNERLERLLQPLIAKHQFIITRLKELVEKKAEIEEKLPSAEASRYNFDVRTTKLAETLKSLREAGETASILVLGGADHFVPSNRGNLAPLMEELAHSNATVLLPKVLDRSKFL